ncbi:MAG: HDOD domain-containing protein [Lentisphaerae bacterium]|nr:HDOD domain-containing protein [Lentisphaerota bacterium]
MAENPENAGDKKLVFSEKDKFLLRISSVTDLTVPPVILEQIFPILEDEKLPDDFGCSKLMHDPSIVVYFLKQLYEDEANREKLYSGMDDIFNHLSKENMYALLSEMSPMAKFESVEIEEWKHAYSSHLLMYALVTENEFTQLRYLVPLMLVHDIGKLVLHQMVPDTCDAIVERSRQRMIPRSMAEMDRLELTHADAGARLLKEWHFPANFYKPIQYHHSSKIPEEYVLETALVQFVNWVDCHVRGIPATPLRRATMAAAGIEEIDTEYWISRHKKIVAEINSYFEPEGIMNKKTN